MKLSMEWTQYRHEDGLFFYKTNTFNGFTYYLEVHVDFTYKSEVYWFALSSGNKRRDLKIFEEKDKKSRGGMAALLWVKDEILNFPDFYRNPLNKKRYIGIGWADTRRRDIYARSLLREGFQFQVMNGRRALIKKL